MFSQAPISFARLGFGLEGFESNTMTKQLVTKVGLELLGQIKKVQAGFARDWFFKELVLQTFVPNVVFSPLPKVVQSNCCLFYQLWVDRLQARLWCYWRWFLDFSLATGQRLCEGKSSYKMGCKILRRFKFSQNFFRHYKRKRISWEPWKGF